MTALTIAGVSAIAGLLALLIWQRRHRKRLHQYVPPPPDYTHHIEPGRHYVDLTAEMPRIVLPGKHSSN